MSNDLDDLIKELDELIRVGKLRRENPYALDLIAVLYPFRGGLPRRQVINELWKRRGKKGLNTPKAFEQTVQSAFQQYAGEYAAFQKRGARDTDNLFFAPKGLGAGWWSVRQDRADAWLAARKKEIQQV